MDLEKCSPFTVGGVVAGNGFALPSRAVGRRGNGSPFHSRVATQESVRPSLSRRGKWFRPSLANMSAELEMVPPFHSWVATSGNGMPFPTSCNRPADVPRTRCVVEIVSPAWHVQHAGAAVRELLCQSTTQLVARAALSPGPSTSRLGGVAPQLCCSSLDLLCHASSCWQSRGGYRPTLDGSLVHRDALDSSRAAHRMKPAAAH